MMIGVSNDTMLLGPSGLMLAGTVIAVALVIASIIFAASRITQGGAVERPERVSQLYGYTVCLIALIWGLTSIVSIVDNAITMSAPELHTSSPYGFEPSVSSFEAFRSTYDRNAQFGPNGMPITRDTIPEAQLRARYEGLRADRIARGRFEAQRSLITSLVSLLIAAGLFSFHWRWLRRRVPPVSS